MDAGNEFLKTLNKTISAIEKADGIVMMARWLYFEGKIKEAYEQTIKLEEQTERLVLLTRSLPAYTGAKDARDRVEKVMEETIPVEIGYTEQNWFSVRIPMLLPKKSEGSANYIRSFLYGAMKRFFSDKQPVRYTNCVLIYRHVYDRNRPERKMRDHDNIEINMVSDTLALYVMPDDAPSVCAHYYCSAAGSLERTEVYVVPKEDFSEWLVLEKTMPKEGVKLYESGMHSVEKDV